MHRGDVIDGYANDAGGIGCADGLIERDYQPLLAADARDAAFGFVAELHPGPPTLTTQSLVLVVSELVTNSLRHAGAVTSMRLRADRWSITVIVEDPSPVPPQNRSPDFSGRTGGFGWPMIRQLSDRVTVVSQPGAGKAIMVSLPR